MESQKIEGILTKYWAGESSLEEERTLRDYFNSGSVDQSLVDYKPLFVYFQDESVTSLDRLPSSYIQEDLKPKAKLFSINTIRSMAAGLILLMGALIGFNYLESGKIVNDSSSAEMIQDPEEALEITKEALAYLSVNFKKGSDPLSTLPKSIKSTKIFK